MRVSKQPAAPACGRSSARGSGTSHRRRQVLILALAAALGGADARGQDAGSGPATQIWLNVTPTWAKSDRVHLELDAEAKWQVSEGDEWRNFDLTPLVEYYPVGWLDLQAETTVGNTLQRDGLDTFELTPRIGARLHLFAKLAPHRPGIPGFKHDRVPLTRLGFSTLARLEWRNFWYSDATPDQHTWRARLRFEGKLAVNRRKLSEDRLLYAIADVEYYWPLGDDIPETYVNKLRARTGLGYRFSAARKLELLYIRDWNRSSPQADAAQDSRSLDLRLRLLF